MLGLSLLKALLPKSKRVQGGIVSDDTQGPAAKVHEYEQSVIAYEKLHHEITEYLSARGGHSEDLSDEEFAHYRELAELRDLAYNRMKTLETTLLDES